MLGLMACLYFYEESGDVEAHGLSLLLRKLEIGASIDILSEVLDIARLRRSFYVA